MGERIRGVQEKEYNGTKYRSTLEADTAEVLTKLGIPFEYESRRITLLNSFHCPYQKEKIRAIHYTPDFNIGSIMLECKGFETPEWKTKKKYIFKYLMENEPKTIYLQIHDCKKELIKAFDSYWVYLGFCVQVQAKPTKKTPSPVPLIFDSIAEAMHSLGLIGKPVGSIMKSLVSDDPKYVYGYDWKLKKINL